MILQKPSGRYLYVCFSHRSAFWVYLFFPVMVIPGCKLRWIGDTNNLLHNEYGIPSKAAFRRVVCDPSFHPLWCRQASTRPILFRSTAGGREHRTERTTSNKTTCRCYKRLVRFIRWALSLSVCVPWRWVLCECMQGLNFSLDMNSEGRHTIIFQRKELR